MLCLDFVSSNRVSPKRLFNIHRCAAVYVVCDLEKIFEVCAGCMSLKKCLCLSFPKPCLDKRDLKNWRAENHLPISEPAHSVRRAPNFDKVCVCINMCQTTWKTQVPADCSLPWNLQHHRRWRTLSHPGATPVIMSLHSVDPSTCWINSFCFSPVLPLITSGSCFSSASVIRTKSMVKFAQTEIQLRSCLWQRNNTYELDEHIWRSICAVHKPVWEFHRELQNPSTYERISSPWSKVSNPMWPKILIDLCHSQHHVAALLNLTDLGKWNWQSRTET